MTIFGEPIATWISIAAILISLSTLLLTRRKQQYEERAALAKQIAEIKTKYGEGLRIVEGILTELNEYEKVVKSAKKSGNEDIETFIQESRTNMTKLQSSMKSFYDKLGYHATRTTDPVVLSAVTVEVEDMMKLLEQSRSYIENSTHETEKKSVRKRKANKSIENTVPHSRLPKK